jgi:hypothetical protein
MTGCEDERRLKLHRENSSFVGMLCSAIQEIWSKGLSRDILAVHCGCIAVLCSGNDLSSAAFRDTASGHDIIPILHMLHKGLQSETATLLKRPDAKHSTDIQFKLKRNQSTLTCVLSAISGFSFKLDAGSGAQLVKAKLCNELIREVFAPLYPDENVQNASLQILGRMLASDVVAHALFHDIQHNRVIEVFSACVALITDPAARTESVVGCCSVLEKLTRHEEGARLLLNVLGRGCALQAMLPFVSPVHCLKRLRPHLLNSPDAQLSKLSSVFLVAIDVCKSFSRLISSVSSMPSFISALREQQQQSLLSFTCLFASDVLIACSRREPNLPTCPLVHWSPPAAVLPSSQDDLVLKLTLAMNTPVSLSWVHAFVQLVIVMYDCSELSTTIVPPISCSIKPEESVEAALHALSKSSNLSIQTRKGLHDGSDHLDVGISEWGFSKAVFSMCISILCCDLTSCEGAKVVLEAPNIDVVSHFFAR